MNIKHKQVAKSGRILNRMMSIISSAPFNRLTKATSQFATYYYNSSSVAIWLCWLTYTPTINFTPLTQLASSLAVTFTPKPFDCYLYNLLVK